MPIVTCSCGAKLKVAEKLMGKTAKCPKCGELIELIVGQWPTSDREKTTMETDGQFKALET